MKCYNKRVEKTDKKTVGILRGGSGFYHENSLSESNDLILYILENLSDKWKIVDIFIDKNNVWHANGIPIDFADLVDKVDFVWNISCPSFSKLLESLSIPTIGISSFLFAMKNDRSTFLENININNLKIPRHIILPLYQEDFDGPRERYSIKKAKEVHEKFPAPWIVKSLTSNSSMGPVRGREGSQRPSASNGMGVHVAETFPELVNAIEDGVNHKKSILVEEFILGKNTTVHTVSGFRNQDIYVFPIKDYINVEKEKLINLAQNIHKFLEVSHYLKSDFVINPNKGIYLTNVEFLPDLNKDSHFCSSCISVGAKTNHIIEHILNKF